MTKHYKAIAAYYDAEYADSKMLQEDVPFFLGSLPVGRRLSVLELCVGTGRAAIPIARAGHRVVGVDNDPALLAIARQKCDAAGLSVRKLELVHADVREFDLGRRFDRVCIFFNTLLAFPSLEEQDQLLGRVRAHLRPGGRFWLDIFNPDLHLLAQREHRGLSPHLFHVPELGRTVLRTTDIVQDPAKQLQTMTFHYTWYGPDRRLHRKRIRFEATWLFPRELRLLLERNGLVIEHLFGNYDGSGVTDRSPRLIASCKLAGGGRAVGPGALPTNLIRPPETSSVGVQ